MGTGEELDAAGRSVRVVSRAEMRHLNLLHRVVYVLVVDAAARLLVHRHAGGRGSAAAAGVSAVSSSSAAGDRLVVEDRLGDGVVAELRRRGHEVEVRPGWSLGRLSAVADDSPAAGLLRAAANPSPDAGPRGRALSPQAGSTSRWSAHPPLWILLHGLTMAVPTRRVDSRLPDAGSEHQNPGVATGRPE